MEKEFKTTICADITIVVKESIAGGFYGYCKEIEGAVGQGETEGDVVLSVKNGIAALMEARRLDEMDWVKFLIKENGVS